MNSNGVQLSVRILKRAIDVAVAALLLALTAPLFPLIMLAIYLEDGRPVFYKQRRAGTLESSSSRGGERRPKFGIFTMHKFRTMRRDAESGVTEAQKRAGQTLARVGDPRVTRVGRLLRRARLDELPQLVDVLLGRMSLVGPRPERPDLMDNLVQAIPFFEERMRGVKPGLTGLAQISLGYRGEVPEDSPLAPYAREWMNPFHLDELDGDEEHSVADDMRMKLLFDIAYVASMEKFWTYLLMEFRIILRTPWVMLRGAGC